MDGDNFGCCTLALTVLCACIGVGLLAVLLIKVVAEMIG